MKVVYQTNAAGQYTGPIQADESPLEPGVWLIPAGCVEDAPPPLGDHEIARWDGTSWQVETLPMADPVEPHASTLAEILAQAEAAIDRWINDQARTLGYDSIVTAVSYADEPAVPRYQAEGRALRAWRSRVYAAAYEIRATVVAGSREMPASIEALIAELPAFVMPEEAA
ncbi:hypothetical protein [Leptothrix discophora]|uniref:Phage tail protein n=1 Tax=Leptothrix discophora TaxID=89 RepID=A0ABT9G1J9_LEPDI|nr:hypothetical protein [Leptothrix discophora]MDP4300336.1 hypothetical protein [Leptothrix discophora]